MICLCWEFEANPTYDNHPRGEVNRVMVSFANLNYVKEETIYMQVYDRQYKDNCI